MKSDSVRAGYSAIDLIGIYYEQAINELLKSQNALARAEREKADAETIARLVIAWAEGKSPQYENPESMGFVKEARRILESHEG